MSASDLLKEIYTKFYDQREVLVEAPSLSQNPSDTAFDSEKANKELAAVISYLMGVDDIQKESFEQSMKIIQEHYGTQPEWKEVLIEYFEYITQKEKEELEAQEDTLIKEIEEFTKKLLAEEENEKTDLKIE